MNTRDRAESLVQELHDMACDGEVREVLILARNSEGQLLCAFASDDMVRLVDEARAAIADVESEYDPQQSHRLN